MRNCIYIDPRVYLLWAALLLLVPLDWLGAAFFAAAVHEGAHLLIIFSLGGKVNRIKIRPGGAEIEVGLSDLWQELLCTLAGPVGSFSLVLLCRVLPKTAICAAIQGCFNLLPIYPLDGGRALRCCFRLLQRKKPCKQGQFNVQ